MTVASDVGARIDGMPFTRWHLRMTAILGSARFFDALDTTTLAFVLPVLIGLWHLTAAQAGLLISASYVGQLAGAVGGGILAERIGRIPALRLCLLVTAVASVACAFSSSYLVLFALRAGQGLGLGGEAPISATYMNEVCPARQRSQAVVSIQLIYGAGIVFTSFLALLVVPHLGWRALFVLGGLPATTALALPWILPESPRWLAATGQTDRAEAAVAGIEARVGHVTLASADRPVAAQAVAAPEPARLRALLAPGLVRPTMSAWIVAFCAAMVSYALLGWMPTIYRQVYHLPVQTALRYSAISSGMSLVGAILAIFIVARAGPRRSITFGLVGVGCGATLIAVMGTGLGAIGTAVVVAFLFTLISIPISGLFAYSPELYPTHIRALGVGLATAWVRIAAIIVPPVVGMLLGNGGVTAVFAFLAGAALTGALGIAWLGNDRGYKDRVTAERRSKEAA